jgi:hypothetical protein
MIERTENATTLASHPRPPAGWVFALVAGPLAWFVQLNIGYALTTGPCFAVDQRLAMPVAGLAWTRTGADVLVLVCAVAAMAAFAVSWRVLRVCRQRHDGPEAGHLCRFIATWGTTLSAGFGVATLFTAVGLLLLPRCGG